MKFLGFSKIWRRNSQNIFHFKNFFFFLKKIIFKKFSPDFGKTQNFMISFFHPLNLNRNLFLLKKIPLLPEKDQANSEDFILIRLFPRQTLKNIFSPKKMINLLQETKKKVEEKIFSPDFQNSTEDQFLPQHFMRNLPLSLRKTF